MSNVLQTYKATAAIANDTDFFFKCNKIISQLYYRNKKKYHFERSLAANVTVFEHFRFDQKTVYNAAVRGDSSHLSYFFIATIFPAMMYYHATSIAKKN